MGQSDLSLRQLLKSAARKSFLLRKVGRHARDHPDLTSTHSHPSQMIDNTREKFQKHEAVADRKIALITLIVCHGAPQRRKSIAAAPSTTIGNHRRSSLMMQLQVPPLLTATAQASAACTPAQPRLISCLSNSHSW